MGVQVSSANLLKDSMETKFCHGCKDDRPVNEFWKAQRHGKTALYSRCKKCEGERKYELHCVKCSDIFHVSHRHWRKIKVPKCLKCHRIENGERNAARAGESIRSTKGYEYVKEHGSNKYAFNHRLRVSQHLGRPLTKEEVVHHLDGDKLNNYIENLWLCDAKKHNAAHRSLELIALEMYRNGEVIFNKDTGQYERAPNDASELRSASS